MRVPRHESGYKGMFYKGMFDRPNSNDSEDDDSIEYDVAEEGFPMYKEVA